MISAISEDPASFKVHLLIVGFTNQLYRISTFIIFIDKALDIYIHIYITESCNEAKACYV